MNDIIITTLLILTIVVLIVPPIVFFVWYMIDKRQSQHSILRNFPLLGRIRYVFEMMGPELRQYMFDSDNEGKPFSRMDFQNVVVAGKYMKTLIAFGSKRDFDKPGWFLRNSMFPKLAEEMHIVCDPKIKTKRYVGDEGLFSRREHLEEVEVQPWLLRDEDAIIIGPSCNIPWRLKGPVGMSAMSFGALGENAISSMSMGNR